MRTAKIGPDLRLENKWRALGTGGQFFFPVIARLLYYFLPAKRLSVQLSYLCVFFPVIYDQDSYC